MNRSISLCFCLLFLTCVSISAQELKVDKVTLLETDDEAKTNPRYDGNGEICALLKIYINDLPNLKFGSSFVIDEESITYKGGYYTVYVANGIRTIMLKHRDYLPVTINFKKDFRIYIEGGKTYRIDASTSGIVKKPIVAFNMLPREGILSIDGKQHPVSEGMLQLDLEPGNYSYTATADYHYPKEGTFSVTNDTSEPQIIQLSLKPIMADVNFTCNVPIATLYVDNSNKGRPGMKSIPMGKHRIRVKANDWKDFVQEVVINQTNGQELAVKMLPKSFVSIVVKVKGTATPYLYIDNKIVKDWSNGKPFKIKLGRHLITVTNGDSFTASKRERSVMITPNMEAIEFSF